MNTNKKFTPRRGRGSSSRRPTSGGSRRRGGGRRSNAERIDINRFINKAEPIAEQKVYEPKNTFTDFGFNDEVTQSIAKRGYIYPTPIQDQAIPAMLAGKDMLGIADTGTGKTAAFLLPILNAIINNRKQQALILAPTRELALQIQKELSDFVTRDMRIFSVALVGGAPMGPQISHLKRGVSIIIGTPGRTQDMIRRGLIDLGAISHMVLDEADRMLDMGFVKEITEVLEKIPADSQKYFFSATMAKNVEGLMKRFLDDPQRIMVKKTDTSKHVNQDIIRVAKGGQKIDMLHMLLTKDEVRKTVVFAETKRAVQGLADELSKRGLNAGALHGDKRHRERVRTLDKFKKNHLHVLVATDVAARGLDVPDVTHVINYEVPQTYDTYIHRIGRTGRAGKQGAAFTFV